MRMCVSSTQRTSPTECNQKTSLSSSVLSDVRVVFFRKLCVHANEPVPFPKHREYSHLYDCALASMQSVLMRDVHEHTLTNHTFVPYMCAATLSPEMGRVRPSILS